MTEADAYRVLEDELALLFRRTRAISAEVAREVHPELESDAYGLMAAIDRTGRSRVSDLAAAIGVGKATMSRQVRALETLGLVGRAPDPDDGRAVILDLTDDGRARYRSIRDARRARLRRLFTTWPEGDVAEFGRLLRRFNSERA